MPVEIASVTVKAATIYRDGRLEGVQLGRSHFRWKRIQSLRDRRRIHLVRSVRGCGRWIGMFPRWSEPGLGGASA